MCPNLDKHHQPYLTGLFVYRIDSTFHRAEQGLDLIGRLLQQETSHELVDVSSSFIHLVQQGGGDKDKN